MEKIKVNMSPNPLDVQTIHASQNDAEARQWEFELHNNGELIDTSEVTEQMLFKAYKGGTEQILPENTSTPTTSPFIGDIRYPQGLLTDQEFTYRQSPTESDGLAKITDVKGNTLVWNQLVGTNVNGLSTIQGTTFSLNSNGSIHVTGTGTGNHFCEWRTYENPDFILIKGHKYLVKFKGLTTGIIAQVSVSAGQTIYIVNKVDFVGDYDEIFTPTQDGITGSLVRFYATNAFSGTTDITMQLFDLTQMGLDITDPSDFTSLFPLPYYDYCKGAMLSFGGRNVKFNQLFTENYSVTFETGNTSAKVVSRVTGITKGHKCLLTWVQNKTLASNTRNTPNITYSNGTNQQVYQDATSNRNLSSGKYGWVFDAPTDNINNWIDIYYWVHSPNVEVTMSSFNIIDLTEMFGVGNEPSTEGFKGLFQNDYYEYNVGQYMNIGQPVSLKTTGKNLAQNDNATNQNRTQFIYTSETLQNVSATKNATGGSFYFKLKASLKANTTYKLSVGAVNIASSTHSVNFYIYSDALWGNAIYLNKQVAQNSSHSFSFTEDYEDAVIGFFVTGNTGIGIDVNDIMLTIGSADTTEFVDYIEPSTLSIPLDEFPDGMDGINDVKDEKNETEYVKRIGQITFDGTQTPVINTVTSTQCRAFYNVSDVLPVTRDSQVIEQDLISNYLPCNSNYHTNLGAEGIHRRIGGQTEICVSLGLNRGITTWDEFKAYLSAHPLTVYYPLNVPLENYGIVDLGTLNWTYSSDVGHLRFYTEAINDSKKPSSGTILANIICNKYQTITESQIFSNTNIGICLTTTGRTMVYDPSYSSADSFKQAMSGVYLLYEKENPQGFTTASLVTENAEIPLSNEDGTLVGKCTEQLSAEPGFHDAKIKLSDGDGTCYSNKLQLHVERKPS